MPHERTETLYNFDELSDKAKEKARDWYREGGFDYEWWDSVYVDAVQVAGLFGLTISESVETYSIIGKPGTKSRKRTNIMFSGFCSQGDGACFEGSYEFKADAIAAVKDYAPKDETLHSIVEDLQTAQASAANRVKLKIKHTGHYCHERSMSMEMLDESNQDDEGDWLPDADQITAEQQKAVEEALIRFAKWIYRQLEAQYDYFNSDESVDENIIINEYDFYADGSRA